MRRGYKKPPIKEVKCEFRFKQGSPWDTTIPGLIYNEIKEEYPHKQKGREIELEFGEEAINQNFKISDRIRLSNEDKSVLVEIGPNHLIINLLTNYTSWEDYSEKILRILEVYNKIAEPEEVQRAKLKYTNEIIIPKPFFDSEGSIDLEDHLNIHPYLGEGFPTPYRNFSLAVQFLVNNDDTLKVDLKSSGRKFNLYFSYFNEQKITDMNDWINKAHESITTNFEACIKDSLRETFEEV